MTIEVHTKELEALIQQRMASGLYKNVEEALVDALKTTAHTSGGHRPETMRTGADLVAAMRASPYKEIELETAGVRLPVRGVAF